MPKRETGHELLKNMGDLGKIGALTLAINSIYLLNLNFTLTISTTIKDKKFFDIFSHSQFSYKPSQIRENYIMTMQRINSSTLVSWFLLSNKGMWKRIQFSYMDQSINSNHEEQMHCINLSVEQPLCV